MTARVKLTACARTRKFCVVCERWTDKFAVQAVVLDDQGNWRGVVCPSCLEGMPTSAELRRQTVIADAWDDDCRGDAQ